MKPALSQSQPKHYLPQLDGLRAVAIFLVMLHHWAFPRSGLGIMGVQLFFVLSGFLITGILLRLRDDVDAGRQSASFSVRHFYARRFLRIFPLYYFCLFAFLAVGRFGVKETFWWHFSYASNIMFFLQGRFGGPLSHFWSLSVEEQFYMFWPFVVLCVPRRYLTRVVIVGILSALVTRITVFQLGHTAFAETSTLAPANFDTLGAGALLAIATASERTRVRDSGWLRLGIGLCIMEICFVRWSDWSAVAVWLDPLAVAGISAWAVWRASLGFTGVAGRLLSCGVAIFIGRISYGLYVWHNVAPALVGGALRAVGFPSSLPRVLEFGLCFVCTVGIASLTWYLIERPCNSLKRFFHTRKEDWKAAASVPSGCYLCTMKVKDPKRGLVQSWLWTHPFAERTLCHFLRQRLSLPTLSLQSLFPDFDQRGITLRQMPRGGWSTPLADVVMLLKLAACAGSKRLLEIVSSFRGYTALLLAQGHRRRCAHCYGGPLRRTR